MIESIGLCNVHNMLLFHAGNLVHRYNRQFANIFMLNDLRARPAGIVTSLKSNCLTRLTNSIYCMHYIDDNGM